MEITKIVKYIMIFGVILVFIIVAYAEDREHDFCRENYGFIDNRVNNNIYRDGDYCCTNGPKIHSYERDQGTLNYFLFGKTAYYGDTNCVLIEGVSE